MVGTIGPLVQGARLQWAAALTIFVTSGLVAGATVGLALAIVGELIRASATPVLSMFVGIVALVAVAIDSRLLRLPTPTLHRSVPQTWWILFGPFRASAMYGFVLGLGFTTFVPFASFYAVLAAAMLLGLPSGVAVGVAYGAGRVLPVLASSIAIAAGADARGLARIGIGSRRLAAFGCALASLVLLGGTLATAV